MTQSLIGLKKMKRFQFHIDTFCRKQFICLPASGYFVAIATLQFEGSDFTLRGDNQSRLFGASVGSSAHFAPMDYHVGDGYGNGEHLDFLNDHRLAGICANSFDDFAVI